jgi:hypothetical protein
VNSNGAEAATTYLTKDIKTNTNNRKEREKERKKIAMASQKKFKIPKRLSKGNFKIVIRDDHLRL